MGLEEHGRILTVETVRILRLVLGRYSRRRRGRGRGLALAVAGVGGYGGRSGSSSSDWYSVCPAHCGPDPSKARDLPSGPAGAAGCACVVTRSSAWSGSAAVCHAKERGEAGRCAPREEPRRGKGKARESLDGWNDGWDAGSRRDTPGYGWLAEWVELWIGGG